MPLPPFVRQKNPVAVFPTPTLPAGHETQPDTVAGALLARSGMLPEVGDKVVFENVVADVIEVSNDRADKIRFVLTDVSDDETS